jgi:tetratricopeptide (TPR) repeat protein
LINLGNLYLFKGRAAEAIDYFAKADALKPGDAGVMLNLARANFELGVYAKTKELYAKAKAKDPVLAQRYAFLSTADAGRASDAADLSGLYWDVE